MPQSCKDQLLDGVRAAIAAMGIDGDLNLSAVARPALSGAFIEDGSN